jgi:GTP-binding protein HflX
LKKAILIGITYHKGFEIEKSLAELGQLVRSIGIDPVATFWQLLRAPSPSYMGKGKLEKIASFIGMYGADGVVVDDELSTVQKNRIHEFLKVEILDRTQIILRAFSTSATTNEGKIEVELATLEYDLSHLKGSADLSRQGGGIGTVGPGESKLEMDRRTIKQKISRLHDELDKISKNKVVKKGKRESSVIPKISIVGYTNAGKSMLLKALSGFDVKSEDRLFTTLDPITKKVWLGQNLSALFSDTVGFISKLPTQLVRAFKSTLDEIRDADLLLLVLDGSDENIESKYSVSIDTIQSIGASSIPVLKIINKIDLCDEGRLSALSHDHPDAIFISAQKGLYLEDMVSRIRDEVSKDYVSKEIEVSAYLWSKISTMSGIRILNTVIDGAKVRASLLINPAIISKFMEFEDVLQ